MKISNKWIRLCNITCAVLLLALLVCQLLPFWTMPGCTCTGSCAPGKNKFEDPTIDPTCKACTVTYKWCVNLAPEHMAGTDPNKLLDTSEDWQVSIQQFIWFPKLEFTKGVMEYFDSVYTTDTYEFMLNDIKDMPVAVFFFALISAYLCFFVNPKNPIFAVLPLFTGIISIKTYLTMPIYQTGMLWQVHLVIAILATLISIVPICECIFRAIHWLDPRKS